jgi:hypothetical protein
MKKIIIIAIMVMANISTHAQLTFVNQTANAALCKLEIINGKTSVYEDINNACPVYYTWHKVPVLIENDYSEKKYRMTGTMKNSISKRTYEISYRILSGAGENKGKKNMANIKLTIDYFEKNRPTKVVNYSLEIQY